MDEIVLRTITPDDRPRIAEISSQIWDGNDWVPSELDRWLADRDDEAVAASLDGRLIGFAHRTWLCPGHAWFEGIRTDPAFRGRGAGRAITRHLIDGARRAGATKIHLSTYFENEASIHIVESFGFRRVASFAYLEGTPQPPTAEAHDATIVRATEAETIAFVDRSPFLALAGRRFPRGWRFFPFDVDPAAAVAGLATRLAVRRHGRHTALACVQQRPEDAGYMTLNFADGEPDDVRRLLAEVHHLYAGRTFETMVPKDDVREACLLPILRELGYGTWDDYAAGVFVYELAVG